MSPTYPTPLQPGDTIALVAPAGVPDQVNIDRFCDRWKRRGFQVTVKGDLCARRGYLSDTDQARASAIMSAFTDSEVAAVFAVRGGYGANRLVDLLKYDIIAENPKIFAGFSDMTTLHTALNRHCNLVTFHSPHPNDGLGKEPPCHLTMDSFVQAVTMPLAGRNLLQGTGDALHCVSPGVAAGQLTGGNLAVLVSTLGSPHAVDTTDKVLFLEDVGEEPYRIDRYLSQLRLAGCLSNLRGLLLGHFIHCDPSDPERSLSLDQVFSDYFDRLGIPVISGIASGHDLPNLTLPMHAIVQVNATELSVRVADDGLPLL